MKLLLSLLVLSLLDLGLAATADQWRSRSIYQVITDRFAHSSNTPCDPGAQSFCGGTWKSITQNLDYIAGMGFTAIWISPVHKNIAGRTPYGEAYHGYWVQDLAQLEDRFGTKDDLRTLIQETHQRGMYIMVDIVVNHVASLGGLAIPNDLSPFTFKESASYHHPCQIEFSNSTSAEQCWLGDENVALMDINTESQSVISTLNAFISSFVSEFNIDGLRIDAQKHIRKDFWPGFCAAAGVFCIGEVYEKDITAAAPYQGGMPGVAGLDQNGVATYAPGSATGMTMDSILNFPAYFALVDAFAIPGKQNMSALVEVMRLEEKEFRDVSTLGNFLENQDVPRWRNASVDPQSLYNAMTFNFMAPGIPIVYYGQEQAMSGGADPYNREPLRPSGYANTTAYQLIARLNKLRSHQLRIAPEYFNSSRTEIPASSEHEIALLRGNVLTILTNIGSPPMNESFAVYTPWERNVATVDILTCVQYVVGSGGSIDIEYSLGGKPVILVPAVFERGSGLCNTPDPVRAVRGSAHATRWLLPNIISTAAILLVVVVWNLVF